MHTTSIITPNITQSKSDVNSKQLWIAFLLWPLLGFILAWRKLDEKASKKVIIAFYILYGLLYVINPAMDGSRRAEMLRDAYQKPFSDVNYFFDNLFESTLDFLDPLIIYSVSRITDFHGILFATYALIFGVLSMNFFLKLRSKLNKSNKNFVVIVFLAVIVLTNSIFEIGGFRMWCATWIFALGTLNFLLTKKKVFLAFAGVSIVMHFSYLPLVAILFLYSIVGNKTYVFAVLALVSFAVSELNIESVRQYAALISPAYETKITAYTHDGYIEQITELNQQSSWFLQLAPQGLLYFSVFSIFIILFKKTHWREDIVLKRLINISLLLLSFSNISSLLPSGGRFRTIYFIFTFATLAYYYSYFRFNYKVSALNYVGLFFISLKLLIIFRIGFETLSVYTLFPSVFLPIGFFDIQSVKDLLF